jgi:hypothetical protein
MVAFDDVMKGITSRELEAVLCISSSPCWNFQLTYPPLATALQVARSFGFQVFNSNPKPLNPSIQWTPATAFVATDHLTSLLRDVWLRM